MPIIDFVYRCRNIDWKKKTKNLLLMLGDNLQELRSREEELTKAQVQQKQVEENLKQREKELAAREIDLLERELTVMIFQQQNTPTPIKRKGKFKKSKLKLNKKEPGSKISAPSGKQTCLKLSFLQFWWIIEFCMFYLQTFVTQ